MLLVRMITVSLNEVDPALRVGQPALFHDLQQDVEHARVRLLDFVEQHDRAGALAHLLGELPAPLVAHVAGRRADQPVDGVILLVFGHVQHHHRVLAAEHELGQRLGQLGLAHAGGSEEEERADGPLGVFQPDAGDLHRPADRQHRLVLADDALVQRLDHVGVAGALVHAELA